MSVPPVDAHFPESPPAPAAPYHLEFPRLRPVDAAPFDSLEGQVFLLHDRSMYATAPMALTSAGLQIARHFDGTHSLNGIAAITGQAGARILQLARSLDESLLIEGPTVEAFVSQHTQDFDNLTHLPIRAAEDFTVERMNHAIESALPDLGRVRKLSDPQGNHTGLRGLVVPHLDFDRGEPNYAAGYAALKLVLEQGGRGNWRPDRVIILGTNHFGRATGVLMCPRGFETTAGPLDCDGELAQIMDSRLGAALTEHRIDLFYEHSLELQAPWVRHVIGNIPTLGFLVHDPIYCDGASYDGRGISLQSFVPALSQSLEALGGRTLIITSADLSHIGPYFGDEQPNTIDRLEEVREHDMRHLGMLLSKDEAGFVSSMQEHHNRTHWCTIGGLTAQWQLLRQQEQDEGNGLAADENRAAISPHLLRYEQATDNLNGNGQCCVTSAAMIWC